MTLLWKITTFVRKLLGYHIWNECERKGTFSERFGFLWSFSKLIKLVFKVIFYGMILLRKSWVDYSWFFFKHSTAWSNKIFRSNENCEFDTDEFYPALSGSNNSTTILILMIRKMTISNIFGEDLSEAVRMTNNTTVFMIKISYFDCFLFIMTYQFTY